MDLDTLARKAIDATGLPPARAPLAAKIKELAPELSSLEVGVVVGRCFALVKPGQPFGPPLHEPEPEGLYATAPNRPPRLPAKPKAKEPRKTAPYVRSQESVALRARVRELLAADPTLDSRDLYAQLNPPCTLGTFRSNYVYPARKKLRISKPRGRPKKQQGDHPTPTLSPMSTATAAVPVPRIAAPPPPAVEIGTTTVRPPAAPAASLPPAVPPATRMARGGHMNSAVGSFSMEPVGPDEYEVTLRVRVPEKLALFLNGTAHGLLWPAAGQ